jgi:hypothetical protein
MACLLLAAGLLPLAVLAADASRTVTFNKDDAGKLPAGWKAEKVGEGEGSVWKVVADDTAPSKKGHALAQTAKSALQTFNLCVLNDSSYADVELSVAFKAVKGDKDQGGGLMWRYQDTQNYYLARYNPLEANFRVYKIVAGKRTQLGTEELLDLPREKWHTLTVSMKGDQITCSLNGKEYLKAKDATFAKPGKVGLWTKADAQTHFDDLRISGK